MGAPAVHDVAGPPYAAVDDGLLCIGSRCALCATIDVGANEEQGTRRLNLFAHRLGRFRTRRVSHRTARFLWPPCFSLLLSSIHEKIPCRSWNLCQRAVNGVGRMSIHGVNGWLAAANGGAISANTIQTVSTALLLGFLLMLSQCYRSISADSTVADID